MILSSVSSENFLIELEY